MIWLLQVLGAACLFAGGWFLRGALRPCDRLHAHMITAAEERAADEAWYGTDDQ